MNKVLLAIVFSALSCWCVSQESVTTPYCDLHNLKINAPATPFAKISDFYYQSDPFESGAEFRLKNTSRKPVNRVFVIAEYLDSEGNSLFSQYFNYYKDYRRASEHAIAHDVRWHSEFERYLGLGKEVYIIGGAGLRTTVCPSEVRISNVEVEYRDGTHVSAENGDWKIEPEPVSRPEKKIDVAPPELPFRAECVIRIDAEGTATIYDCSEAGVNQKEWLMEVVGHWAFNPALVKGKPENWQVEALILADRFEDQQSAMLKIRTALQSFTANHKSFIVVTLNAENEKADMWRGFWGQNPISFRVPTNFQVAKPN